MNYIRDKIRLDWVNSRHIHIEYDNYGDGKLFRVSIKGKEEEVSSHRTIRQAIDAAIHRDKR